jgi:hypothetical protein
MTICSSRNAKNQPYISFYASTFHAAIVDRATFNYPSITTGQGQSKSSCFIFQSGKIEGLRADFDQKQGIELGLVDTMNCVCLQC